MLPPYVSLSLWLFRAELGDLATWAGVIVNVATLVLALVAGIVSYRIYNIESGRDRRAEEERRERALDARREQASLVSAWFATDVTDLHPSIGSGPSLIGAHILNASNLPIYDVRVFFRPTQNPEIQLPGVPIPVVPPHKEQLMVPLPDQMRRWLPQGDLTHLLDVAIEFRDAAGRRWRRDWDGFLSEVPNSLR